MRKPTLLAAITVFGLLSAAIGACCMPLMASNMSESHCASEQTSDSPEHSCCMVHTAGAEEISKALTGPQLVRVATLPIEASSILGGIPQTVPERVIWQSSPSLDFSIHEICVLRI